MTISAEIIKDSISRDNVRLTTFKLTYPRFIHGEVQTHRMISKNASSSRAQPFKKASKAIKVDIAYPISFTANKPGMQGGDDLPPFKQKLCFLTWYLAVHASLFFASILHKLGAHKQYSNRLSEPGSHITVLATATDWNNFFSLRYNKDAQPEICELAKQMWEAMNDNAPEPINFGDYHLPFITEMDILYFDIDGLIKLSVARCARISYNQFNGEWNAADDIKLYYKLLNSGHFSPFEHQATPLLDSNVRSGNFKGWLQFRQTLPNQNIIEFTPPKDIK